MGQQEVYDFLKRYKPQWFTAMQISKAVNTSINSTTMSLKKLRESKGKIIKFKECFITTKNGSQRKCFKYRL